MQLGIQQETVLASILDPTTTSSMPTSAAPRRGCSIYIAELADVCDGKPSSTTTTCTSSPTGRTDGEPRERRLSTSAAGTG